MTTESLLTKPERAIRVAPSVLAGIGTFTAVGVYVLVSSVGLGLWTSLGPGPACSRSPWEGCWSRCRRSGWSRSCAGRASRAEGIDRGLVIAVVVSLVLLASVMDLLGFQLSMFLFLLYHLKLRGRRTWVSSLIIALAGSVGAFYAFNYGLNVALPVSAFAPLNLIGL